MEGTDGVGDSFVRRGEPSKEERENVPRGRIELPTNPDI
jgi:hypothetical protein